MKRAALFFYILLQFHNLSAEDTIAVSDRSTANFDSLPHVVLEPRESYEIPLPKLAVSFDKVTGKFDRVRISYEGSGDQIIISRFDDQLVRTNKNGREKELHRESLEKAYYLSDFEAKQIGRICKSFIATLELFEKDLQKKNWGRCLYLDAYLPRFLRAFHILLCAARNSNDALPQGSRVPASEYDVSLNSLKSDTRIAFWRSNDEHILKLRIITKELIFQTKQWQKKELSNSKRSPGISGSEKFEEAFALFIQVYFNLAPLSNSRNPDRFH